jgi:hypothetical protein
MLSRCCRWKIARVARLQRLHPRTTARACIQNPVGPEKLHLKVESGFTFRALLESPMLPTCTVTVRMPRRTGSTYLR